MGRDQCEAKHGGTENSRFIGERELEKARESKDLIATVGGRRRLEG